MLSRVMDCAIIFLVLFIFDSLISKLSLVMAKEKLTLTELKVESCVTSLTGDQLAGVKGGAALVQGRRHSYTIRWTAIDTRVQSDFAGTNTTPHSGKG